jgi:TRAP transporter TAXI family solute receptor
LGPLARIPRTGKWHRLLAASGQAGLLAFHRGRQSVGDTETPRPFGNG